GFPGAVEPTRLLAALAVTPAVAMVASVALLARDRLAPLVRVPLVAFAVHVALLAALISPYAENGAAIATLAGEVVYAALMLVAVAGVGGRLSLVRVASGPVAGCVPMVVAAIALGHGAPAIAAALAGYGAVLLLW